jgi:hypothetical protein
MSYAPAILADYNADLSTLSDAALWAYRSRNQGGGQTMGEIATCRGNVRKANAVLRQRGLLVDAKAKQLTKDTTGLVAAAVAPLKAAAMNYAAQQATAQVLSIGTRFAGKDLNEVAPKPSTKLSRIEYRRMQATRSYILSILSIARDDVVTYRPGEKRVQLLVLDGAKATRYVADEREAAGLSFDMYVAKLEGKVGQGVTAASVDNHRLWTGSVLTVTKGAVIERWHTQQIINYSVLGNAYNQWPTRLLKNAEAA